MELGVMRPILLWSGFGLLGLPATVWIAVVLAILGIDERPAAWIDGLSGWAMTALMIGCPLATAGVGGVAWVRSGAGNGARSLAAAGICFTALAALSTPRDS